MLPTAIRALCAARRASPRCLRHFSGSPPSLSDVDPLLLGAPADLRPDADSRALAIGPTPSGSRKSEVSPEYFPPPMPSLNPNHGLYGFFRRNANPNLRGDDQYETFADPTIPSTGRSWLASELRLKSFKDLHTLWYVLLRERNVLATQREEMRRMGLSRVDDMPKREDSARCRKSMARIKAVMNERRLAYEGAVLLATKEQDEAMNAAVLKYKVNMEITEQHQRRAELVRQKIVQPIGSRRAGAKVQARRKGVTLHEGEEKPRWTKAQKLANAQHKQRQAERARKPSKRQLHVA